MRKLQVAGAIAAGFLLALGMGMSSALAAPGNNGTVKIDHVDVDQLLDPPDNNPHVGCSFLIEFRGFDEGNLNASWSLDAQPPSGNKDVNVGSGNVFIGEDPAGGAPDLDATVLVTPDDLTLNQLFEHPQQGFHLKLTVHADGSIGNDTKYKVFWVTGCPPYPATPEAGQTISGTPASATLKPPAPIDWTPIAVAAILGLGFMVGARRTVRRLAKR